MRVVNRLAARRGVAGEGYSRLTGQSCFTEGPEAFFNYRKDTIGIRLYGEIV